MLTFLLGNNKINIINQLLLSFKGAVGMKNSLEIKNNIFWVGSLDFDIRTFDVVMYTKYGTTYNSYLVKGSEKTAIIETSKDKFFDEFLERIKTVTAVEKIDYIVVNHTEPDHSGAVEKLLDIIPDVTVIGSTSAIKFLKEITNKSFKSIIVKEGDNIDLGDKTLKFISAPFLHWPDSMYTYIEEDNIIFTCDSFGCHYCDEKIFNDKIEGDFTDAYKYYFDCIMGPFKEHILKAVSKVRELNVDIICPGHGPILRENIDKYLNLYESWSQVNKENKVIIGYVSAYGYTKTMAQEICKGVEKTGVEAKLVDLETADIASVMADIYTAKGLLLGSPTIVNDALPPVWSVLTSLNQTINKGLVVGGFGSYGWSGEAVNNIESRFTQLKFKMPVKGLKIMFKPSEEQKKLCFDFGKSFGESLK